MFLFALKDPTDSDHCWVQEGGFVQEYTMMAQLRGALAACSRDEATVSQHLIERRQVVPMLQMLSLLLLHAASVACRLQP